MKEYILVFKHNLIRISKLKKIIYNKWTFNSKTYHI